MKIFKTKNTKIGLEFEIIYTLQLQQQQKKLKKIMQYVQRPNESSAKRKTTITLKLKQVCATLRLQVHTGIAMVYSRIQSHMATSTFYYFCRLYIKCELFKNLPKFW